MRLQLIAVSALGLTMATAAAAQQAPAKTSEQFVCELTGECGGKKVEKGPKLEVGEEAAYSFRLPAGGGKPKPAVVPTAKFDKRPPVVVQPGRGYVAPRPAAVGVANMSVSFASGSAVLTAADESNVRQMAIALQTPSLAGRRVMIEGHTDAVGTREHNLILSRNRAAAVASALIAQGTPADRIDTGGFAADRPLVRGKPYAAANRRVQLVLID